MESVSLGDWSAMAWPLESRLGVLSVLAHHLGGKVTCQSSLQSFPGSLTPQWELLHNGVWCSQIL